MSRARQFDPRSHYQRNSVSLGSSPANPVMGSGQKLTNYLRRLIRVDLIKLCPSVHKVSALTVDSSQLTCSKSRDTTNRIDIKNPARANLDIVP